MQAQKDVQSILNRRISVVTWGLVLVSVGLLLSLARFQQLNPLVAREFQIRAQANTNSVRRVPAERGVIYDRDGVPLASNIVQYEVGISPNLVSNPERVAQELGVSLGRDELEIYQQIISPRTPFWELIDRPVSAQIGQEIADKELLGVVINPLSRRAYPQGTLAGPIIGFVIPEDNDNTLGAMGVERRYNAQLAGETVDQTFSTIPLDTPQDIVETNSQRGMDLVLTIDRDIQFFVEQELQRALLAENARSGTIIVMNPSNGDILAMASYPTFDPNDYANPEYEDLLRIPAIVDAYEPGSTMKVFTMAAALESGTITPAWSYYDSGSIEVGGRITRNWDRNEYGLQTAEQLLVNSLNVGAVELSLLTGYDAFYSTLNRFGIGQPTGIDLPFEAEGVMRIPGDDRWSEADFASNSYGQALTATPIQMVTAYAAIANDGLMYQPRLVKQIIDGDEIIEAQPTVRNRAVSSSTANIITDMMVSVVEEGSTLARLEGYTVAGKTGTAEIPSPLGYESGSNSTITSFIGFLPADDPQVVIYIRIDRPDGFFGSRVAAPVFRNLAQRLVILMGIPNDAERRALQEAGGVVNMNQP